MVVQSDLWAGGPEGTTGAMLVKAGTVVEIDMAANPELVAFYGGSGNLAPMPPNQTGDDADHVALEN